MPQSVTVDIAIFGGGIAGLWLLHRLRQQGFDAVLFETHTLGGGQTHKSQGIIHGGMKYALQGTLNSASQSIADMPGLWQACLSGKGEIDLSGVPILSAHQYLFSTGKLAGKLTGFFANVALQGRMTELNKKEYPAVFQNPQFKGLVYALDEIALDVHALVRVLAEPYRDSIYQIDALRAEDMVTDAHGFSYLALRSSQGETIHLHAQKYIFTAGEGNEIATAKLAKDNLKMQRRPLHMVLIKTDIPHPVFAHCFGLGATPRITITTSKAPDGKTIWYLGGQIAEEGVKRDAKQQIEFARAELKQIFPWLDFSNAEFASFFVDRAEPLQAGGKRPDGAYMNEEKNAIVAWPTKLALAPALAQNILKALQSQGLQAQSSDRAGLKQFTHPACAAPLWETLL